MKSLLEDINYGSQPQNHGPSTTASQPPSQSSMIDTLPSHLLEQGDMESRSRPVEHQTSEEMKSLLEDINYGSQPQNHGPCSTTASQPPSQSSMIDTPPYHLLEQGDMMESRSQPVEHQTSEEMKSLLEDINYESQPQNHGPSMTASQPPSQSSMIDTPPYHLWEQGDMESRSQPVEHQTKIWWTGRNCWEGSSWLSRPPWEQ
jgi:hypothetical protein